VRWFWSDWLFVGAPEALAPLAAMTSRAEIFSSNATRCCAQRGLDAPASGSSHAARLPPLLLLTRRPVD